MNKLESTTNFIKKCFNNEIERDPNRIKEVSKYLLISFYFQQSNKNQEDDTAIEFFHNSLWEYLTAEYMWEENKRIVLNTDMDNDLIPLNMDEYFSILQKLIGNKPLKEEVRSNLESIIKIEKKEIKDKIINQSKNVFFKLIENEIVLHYNYKIEKLDVVQKFHNIFEILWTFYYISGLESKNIITTNETLNKYLLHILSPFNFDYKFENINLYEHLYSDCYFAECIFDNVNILHNFNLSFDENIFYNSKLKDIYFSRHVYDNTFNNVVFKNVTISGKCDFSKNKFYNSKFINVRIKGKSWFNKFIKQNSFDEDFLENHSFVEKIEKDQLGDKIKRYYIANDENEDLDHP